MNQVLNENERLLEQVINKDIVNIIMNSSVDIASVNAHECEKFLKFETELLNKKNFVEKEIYDTLLKKFTTLEKHCISLEVDSQLNQEIFQRNNSISNQSAPGDTERVAQRGTYKDFMKCKPLIRAELCEQNDSTDVVQYQPSVSELALLCVRMFPKDRQIKGNVGDARMIRLENHRSISKPKTMQEAIEMATELMDQRVSTMAERQAENKRKGTRNANNNNNQKGTGFVQKPYLFLNAELRTLQKGMSKNNAQQRQPCNPSWNDRAPRSICGKNAGAKPDNSVAAPKLTSHHLPQIHYYDSELADER
ncbi:hypothetical protein Tco_0521738 [Tanacetum coccineum]